MSPKPKAPTQKEIDRALDVFIRAAAAGQPVNPQLFGLAEKQLEEKARSEAPTPEELQRAIDHAADLAVRAAAQGVQLPPQLPSPHVDRMMEKWRKEIAKHKALADQIHDEVYLSAYSQIRAALPESHKRLFQLYGSMVLASYAIDEKSYAFFRSVYLDAKKQLAALEKAAQQRSSKKAAKGGKHV